MGESAGRTFSYTKREFELYVPVHMFEDNNERRKHARITRRVASISNATMQLPKHPFAQRECDSNNCTNTSGKTALREALRACTHALNNSFGRSEGASMRDSHVGSLVLATLDALRAIWENLCWLK